MIKDLADAVRESHMAARSETINKIFMMSIQYSMALLVAPMWKKAKEGRGMPIKTDYVVESCSKTSSNLDKVEMILFKGQTFAYSRSLAKMIDNELSVMEHKMAATPLLTPKEVSRDLLITINHRAMTPDVSALRVSNLCSYNKKLGNEITFFTYENLIGGMRPVLCSIAARDIQYGKIYNMARGLAAENLDKPHSVGI